MIRPRVIPTLLLKGGGLYKTTRFRKAVYVGDPINTVRIFNDKGADELIILSIDGASPKLSFMDEVASEAFMPVGYGGGVKSVQEAVQIFKSGIEKVAVNTAAVETPQLIREMASAVGSQSVVVSIDVSKNWLGKSQVVSHLGKRKTGLDPIDWARKVEDLGAGEILVTSVDREGTGLGYDLELIDKVGKAVSIPVIACGGAGMLEHFRQAVDAGASAVAAGSMFVFHGKERGVLINYPTEDVLEKALQDRS